MRTDLHQLHVDDRDGSVLRVTGEIDASNAVTFESELKAAIGDRRMTVVLSELDFIDSAGVAALGRIAGNHDVTYVVALDAVTRRAIDLVGRDHLPVADSVPTD